MQSNRGYSKFLGSRITLNIFIKIEYCWRKSENDSELIEFLSIKLIKTKLNCLFQRKPVKPKWNWGWINDENHVFN